MAITLTDEMLEILAGLEKGEAQMFLKGIQMGQTMGAAPAPMAAPALPAAIAAPAAKPMPEPGPIFSRASYKKNRGAQADILRALFTGTSSYTQLQEVLRYDRRVVVRALAQLDRQGDVVRLPTANGGEVWQLTPKGRHLAAHYVNNPGLRVLNRQHRQKTNQGQGQGQPN